MDNQEMNGEHKKTSPNSKNKRLFVLLGVLVLMIIIVIIVAAQGKKMAARNGQSGSAVNTNQPANNGTSTANAAVSVKSSDMTPAVVPTSTSLSTEGAANLKTAKVVVPGANPVSSNNVVLTPEGMPTDSAARSTATNAPKQTGFLDKATLPKTLAQVTIANGVFTPDTVTTQAGAPTSFALTSGDNLVHVLNFDDPSLAAVVILVGPGQTKAITFNAPTKTGSYTFHDSTPGAHATGTLIVK